MHEIVSCFAAALRALSGTSSVDSRVDRRTMQLLEGYMYIMIVVSYHGPYMWWML